MKLVISWLFIIMFVAGNGKVFSQISGNINANQRTAREIFAELIGINTTVNMGSTKAAEALAARLITSGFAIGDVILAGPQAEHMNLIIRYRGNGKLRPVLFIGHLDVVEALKEDWSFDPFTFLEKDGYFYGRGTTDMKGDDASLIANLIRLKNEGFIPERDIIVALTEDEEGGNANGVDWLLTNRRNLIDAEYCINPDGGGGNLINGKETVINIQTSEKIYADFTMETHNNGGHSSLPVKDNAIYRLAAALSRLSRYDFPARLNETAKVYFERNAVYETGQVKAGMLAIGENPTDTAAVNRLAKISPFYNALMRTTCVATMLSGGHANNALPQTARANINCRMLPDDNPENVLSALKAVVDDPGIEITCTYSSIQSPLSPLRNDILQKLDQLTATMWPGVIVTPVMSTGATDGRWLRRAGIPVYGISGMFADVNDTRAHGKDERIGVKEFYNGVEFMYRLIKALTSGL